MQENSLHAQFIAKVLTAMGALVSVVMVFTLMVSAQDGAGTKNHCLPLGDVDCSDKVNLLDLTTLIGMFGTDNPSGDLNDSGVVNAADLTILVQNFGQVDDTIEEAGLDLPTADVAGEQRDGSVQGSFRSILGR